jgi:hypothetical protein
MHRLDALPAPFAVRVELAKDPAAWASHCKTPHEAQWIAWNVREDAWYRDVDLLRIQAVIDAIDPALDGPALLLRCAPDLQRVRAMEAAECAMLPAVGVNHVAAGYSRRYELAPESAWAEGSVPGEINPVLPAGKRLRVAPRAGPSFAWVTFEVKGRPVSRDPDEALRSLGLWWNDRGGTVLRVEIPLAALRSAGAFFALPTFFDGLGSKPTAPLGTDWRARPAHEHRPDEPWGNARDMEVDGAALPEIIADITPSGTMDAECIGIPRRDWSKRPYLHRSAPR